MINKRWLILSYSKRFSKLGYAELLGTSSSSSQPRLWPGPPPDFHAFDLLQTQFGTQKRCSEKCFKNPLRPMPYNLQNKYVIELMGREKTCFAYPECKGTRSKMVDTTYHFIIFIGHDSWGTWFDAILSLFYFASVFPVFIWLIFILKILNIAAGHVG